MCGIAGYYDAGEPASETRIRAMTDRVAHRGPDADGFVLADTHSGAVWNGERAKPASRFDLALGHRRLSIIDLSEAGTQPMVSADGSCWVVYNGEIYNYVELRAELSSLGHAFRSETDTEVLLAAYREWGPDFLHRCNGMWAFALWDAKKRELFCARDRFGVKPFYYAHGQDWFVFGSEIKSLLAHPRVARRPNDAMIYDFLSLKLADHTDETFFSGIRRLPAGHTLVYRPRNAPEIRRYWDLNVAFELSAEPADETRATDRFAELFEDAVRLRLRADVPIGTCLSGGLDSSSIVVTANRLMFDELKLPRSLVGDHQRTFSACFDDRRFDERSFIDRIVAQTGASSHRVFPSGDKLWDELPRVVAQMDEPFHSTSQYSQYNVFRLVRESGVTVTLDGQGADELMAGYPGYHGVMLATLVRSGALLAAGREAYATWKHSGRGRSATELALRTAYGLIPDRISTPIRTLLADRLGSRLPEGRSLRVIDRDLHSRFGERRLEWIASRRASMNDLGAKLHADVFRFSLPALLRYEDRNSMAFSIESRTPLLDYRLAEHIFSLPLTMIMRGGWTKWVFRKAMDGRLPTEVQWRKDKMGFVTPEALWMQQGKHRIAEMLEEASASRGYLDPTELRAQLDQPARGMFYTDLFRWYILELWMRQAFAT
ncbi:MAG TPA: asparagine synthase (glutamine-hydrolyzing) [Polyangiales bacterium]|nr:asparagine synthase (glutamine-hydrolyzing) [Polyangiales bacterium]